MASISTTSLGRINYEQFEWEMDDSALYSSFRFFGRYGKESHADAVLRYKLDPGLMVQGYVRHPSRAASR